MRRGSRHFIMAIPFRGFRLIQAVILAASVLAVPAVHALDAGAAEALRQKYTEIKPRFAKNQYGQPLFIESAEAPGQLKGEAYALLDYPLEKVAAALRTQQQWCDVLILHLNTKYCRAAQVNGGPGLTVYIGKKEPEELDQAYRVDFTYKAETSPEYMDVRMTAGKGPMGTSDYRILVEAAPVDNRHTLLHLTYSYAYGMAGKIGMQGYLATVGASKVGFTVTGNEGGQPAYIGGVRGVVERNTMRYYLAIDSYLKEMDAAAGEQQERRLRNWFSATERYARQLHEVEREDYMEMKRAELTRQQQSR
ncbi:MAG: hypothetical protein JWM30_1632 [Burkholderia sp.]|jgi:hypothetical protein|nr:hypothetical protein [Burkholderia sp.]